jgi:hypothetical protein
MYCCKRLRWTLLLIYLISARVAFLLTSKVLQRLPIISNSLRVTFGSSSRKEHDTVTVTIDRPILVLTVSLPKRR